jgi:hypothetical protein
MGDDYPCDPEIGNGGIDASFGRGIQVISRACLVAGYLEFEPSVLPLCTSNGNRFRYCA